MGLQYTFASSYGSGDKNCDRDGNQRCDRCASNCNQSGGQSGDNFSWETCTGGAKPYNEGGWLYRREISLGQHGSSGCKHRCFSVCSPYLGYEQGAKQSPCTDSQKRKFLGYKWKGGGGWHGNNDDVRVSKFNDSNTALQCLFDVNADKLKTWSGKNYITKAGAKDDNGRFMNQYDQMLWGIRIKDGLEQQTGFCHAGNADTVVHQNGKTCQELAADNFSSLPTSDSRWGIWDTLTDASCSKPENLTKIIKPNSNVTCSDRDTSKTLAKQWCSIGENIVTDSQSFCTKEELGTTLYEELAKEYCKNNPDKDFCGCYNVLNNKCLTEENKDLPGCKVTYPTRESINKMPAEYRSNFDGTDKCWGNVCASGTGKYVPEGTIDALCSKTVAVCIADLDVGDLQESGVNIEQNCGSNNQTTDGSTEGTPAPMPDSTTTPLETTTTSTSPSLNEDEEEKAFYEKPEVQIGTVASSLVSIFSCFMLIILAM